MNDLDILAIKAKTHPASLEKLLKQQEAHILKCAAGTCHSFITKSDDEWSVSLMAFSEAVDSYELEKGSFFSFCELVVKRRLIDYRKKQNKYHPEITVDPILFDAEPETEVMDLSLKINLSKQLSKQNSDNIKLEIEAAAACFLKYGFTFYDLTHCSPHTQKTKQACAKAVRYLMQTPLLLRELHDTKQLPLKIIEKNTKVPRKTLERYRKYIIAAIEILSGEYPYLAEYLRFIRKEIKE